MYKDGEPFLNKRFADMVAYAKKSGHVEYIDTTTNGTFMTPERVGPVLEAGIDKINISVDGMTEEDLPALHRLQIRLQDVRRQRQMDLRQQGQLRNRRQDSGRADHRGAAPGILRHLRRSLRPHFRRELRAVLAGVRHRGAHRRQDQQGHLPAGHRRHRHLPLYLLRLFGECRRPGQVLLPRLGPQAHHRRRAHPVDEGDLDLRGDERAAPAASRRPPPAERRLRQLRPAQPLPARQYRRASRRAAREVQESRARSIRTSSRPAAPTANSRPWRRNEDPACRAASRRRSRQSARGHQRGLARYRRAEFRAAWSRRATAAS